MDSIINRVCLIAESEFIKFHPIDYGIYPQTASTACWSGFWCDYTVNDSGIYLKNLYINAANEKYPDINGVSVLRNEYGDRIYKYMGHSVYRDLNIKVNYSGSIVVGDDFQMQYYVHMGYQKPWDYTVLKEFVFKNGDLTEIKDHSEVASQIRAVVDEKIKENKGFYSFFPIMRWKSFSETPILIFCG